MSTGEETSSSSKSRLASSIVLWPASASSAGVFSLSLAAQRLEPALDRSRAALLTQLARMASSLSAICSALCQRRARSARRARAMKRSTSGLKSFTTVDGFVVAGLAHLHQHVEVGVALERLAAGGQQIQQRPDREQIRARVELGADRLLGRHVRELALDDPGGRFLAPVDRLGDAEVGQLHLAFAAEQHVLGRDVAVNDAQRLAVALARVHVGQARGTAPRPCRAPAAAAASTSPSARAGAPAPGSSRRRTPAPGRTRRPTCRGPAPGPGCCGSASTRCGPRRPACGRSPDPPPAPAGCA